MQNVKPFTIIFITCARSSNARRLVSISPLWRKKKTTIQYFHNRRAVSRTCHFAPLQVQLPLHPPSCLPWLLQFFELVWWESMVSTGQDCWGNCKSRLLVIQEKKERWYKINKKMQWLWLANNRVFMKHQRSENSLATTQNFPAKCQWPVQAFELYFSLSGQILLLFYDILLLLQFLINREIIYMYSPFHSNFCPHFKSYCTFQ